MIRAPKWGRARYAKKGFFSIFGDDSYIPQVEKNGEWARVVGGAGNEDEEGEKKKMKRRDSRFFSGVY